MSTVIVIGAGFGGLCAAITAAARGCRVHVLEMAGQAGGKAGTVTIDDVEADTGPSVLTLPEVFGEVFAAAGARLEEQVTLRTFTPAFRYHFGDGTMLDVEHEVEATLEHVRAAFGPSAADDLAKFLAYAADIWDAGAPHFVFGAAPSFTSVMQLGLTHFGKVRRIDSMRSMYRAIQSRVRDPRLRDLLARYATYNGSNVMTAPATLNCIAHVELAMGGYGVEGGIAALVRALERVAVGLGVTFEYDAPVDEILFTDGRVQGVRTRDGREHAAAAVIANADVAHIATALLPPAQRRHLSPPSHPSMSAYSGIVRARRRAEPRPGHQVLFPAEYLEEFRDIFDRDRPPEAPTVYLSAQETCHGRPGWPDHEPLFIMANAPAEPPDEPRDPAVHAALKASTLARARAAGLIDPDDEVVWDRTATGLAAQFPGSRGSIYGAASNSAMAAFKRPANRIRGLPGLYLASGGAHPGGGMPLCALSGVAATDAMLADLGPAALRSAS